MTIERDNAVATGLFRLIHRGVRAGDELIGGFIGVREGDADAERRGDRTGGGGNGLRCGATDFFGNGYGIVHVADSVENDEEFVPADSRGEVVARAQDLAQAAGRHAQDFVAGGMAVDVVDFLEAVEITEKHRQLAP